MRIYQIKMIVASGLLMGTLTCFMSFDAFAQNAGEKDGICCPLKYTAQKSAGSLICCNGPNDENGFSDDCCKAQNGRVIENKQTGKKKCCKNKDPQPS